MAQSERASSTPPVSGKLIIEQLIRNMTLGQFEMNYAVLLPCIYSVYMHPDDYSRLAGVFHLIREDAKRALSAHLRRLNARPFGLPWRRPSKCYRIAASDWSIEFLPDAEGSVPAGHVEIHSELNEQPKPGYHGVMTALIETDSAASPAEGATPITRQTAEHPTRRSAETVYAEIRYEDDSGEQLYLITQNEITIGRGGSDLSVDLALYTTDEVSREHVRLRRDPILDRFLIKDLSTNGTWVNGKRLPKQVEQELPDRAEIDLAEVFRLSFEAKR